MSEDVNAINTGMIGDVTELPLFKRLYLEPISIQKIGVLWVNGISPSLSKSSQGATTVAFEDTILFVNMETVVNLPEVEVETTDIDFGQSAVGIRKTKMVKIRNKTNRNIHFKQKQALNAVGPFQVLNFVRELKPGAMVPLLFNCVPTTPLSVETLVLASEDEYGHQLRFKLKVQGVNPTVEVTGLVKALHGWEARMVELSISVMLLLGMFARKSSL